ncbi:MAG: hypothetical protein PUC84_08395 [Clostridiales bacterium]|nr:hypothetical protein [Clostridiales bacterium]
MNSRKKYIIATIILIIIAFILQKTISFLTDGHSIRNNYSFGLIEVNLIDDNSDIKISSSKNTEKAPKIENLDTSNNAYVFVKVSSPIISGFEMIDYLDKNGNSGINTDNWTLLDKSYYSTGEKCSPISETKTGDIKINNYAIQTTNVDKNDPLSIFKILNPEFTPHNDPIDTDGRVEYVYYYGTNNTLSVLESGKTTEPIFNYVKSGLPKIEYTVGISTSDSSENTTILKAGSQTKGTPLYINIKAKIGENNMKVTLGDDNTKTVPYKVTENGTYTFKATGFDNKGKALTVPIIVNVNQYLVEISDIANATDKSFYYGKKVLNYKPENDKDGVYRIFYYDKTGEFGDPDTLYLKRDWDPESLEGNRLYYSLPEGYTGTDESVTMMKNMNPDLKKNNTNLTKISDLTDKPEKMSACLCDVSLWTKYLDTKMANWAIGGPSAEMYVKSYNSVKHDFKFKTLNVVYDTSTQPEEDYTAGYIFKGDTDIDDNEYDGMYGILKILRNKDDFGYNAGWLLCSPAKRGIISYNAYHSNDNGSIGMGYYYHDNEITVCPIISLKNNAKLEIE